MYLPCSRFHADQLLLCLARDDASENNGDSCTGCAFGTCRSRINGVGTSWRSVGVGGLRHVRNRMTFIDTLDLDLDAALAEDTSPGLAKLRSLRIGAAMSCCVTAQYSVLGRRHLSWCIGTEAARLEWLCKGRPFRGMKRHILLAGNGSSNVV